jgi:phosphoribosyl 1,2-cyclic phosphodiesterase
MECDSSSLDSAALAVRFWGVRGSIPSPGPETAGYGGNTSCVELRVGNEVLVLDAGSGIRRLGLALAPELAGESVTTTLLISHTHWDHIQGLPFFRPAYDRTSRIHVLGAPGTGRKLRAALVSQMDPMQFPVSLDSLTGIVAIDEFAADTTTIGSFTVRTIALNHPGGCTGFRIAAGGISVAYLPDHEPYLGAVGSSDPVVTASAREAEAELTRFLAGSDVLILDSQYDRTEYPRHIGWGHGCLDDSVALALHAAVESLVLFHHDPDHDDHRIDAMLEQARRQVSEAGAQMRVEAARELTQIAPRVRQKRLAA